MLEWYYYYYMLLLLLIIINYFTAGKQNVSCDFEHLFQCGYTTSTVVALSWKRVSSETLSVSSSTEEDEHSTLLHVCTQRWSFRPGNVETSYRTLTVQFCPLEKWQERKRATFLPVTRQQQVACTHSTKWPKLSVLCIISKVISHTL